MSKTLTLYTRANCPLCEEKAAEVSARVEDGRHVLSFVDVDADPVLKARFGWDVPLLFDGEQEICRHFPDPDALRNWFAENP